MFFFMSWHKLSVHVKKGVGVYPIWETAAYEPGLRKAIEKWETKQYPPSPHLFLAQIDETAAYNIEWKLKWIITGI